MLHTGHNTGKDTAEAPTILAALYLKNPKELTYIQTSIKAKDWSFHQIASEASPHYTSVHYAEETRQNLLLLKITVLVNRRNFNDDKSENKAESIVECFQPFGYFATYKVYPILDISARNKELISAKEDAPKAQRCQVS